MHGRNDDVGGEYTETPFGMDLSVNGGGDHGRIPERELTELSVPVEDGAAALAAKVEHGQVAASLGVDMAVHALVFGMAPVREHARVEILQIPLLDFQVIPDFETGLDAPVGQIRIDPVADNVPLERLVLYPLPIDKGCDSDIERLAGRRGHQLFPVVKVEDGLVATGIDDDIACFHFDSLAVLTEQEV